MYALFVCNICSAFWLSMVPANCWNDSVRPADLFASFQFTSAFIMVFDECHVRCFIGLMLMLCC